VSNDEKKTRLAQSLRKRIVPAESLLWKALRNRALAGFKFRRQHPIGPYIVDFACVECHRVIEVDGQSHLAVKIVDKERSRFIADAGWHVIRFWNTEVYEDIEPVKEAIYRECVRRAKSRQDPPHPALSPRRSNHPASSGVVSGRGERGETAPT